MIEKTWTPILGFFSSKKYTRNDTLAQSHKCLFKTFAAVFALNKILMQCEIYTGSRQLNSNLGLIQNVI